MAVSLLSVVVIVAPNVALAAPAAAVRVRDQIVATGRIGDSDERALMLTLTSESAGARGVVRFVDRSQRLRVSARDLREIARESGRATLTANARVDRIDGYQLRLILQESADSARPTITLDVTGPNMAPYHATGELNGGRYRATSSRHIAASRVLTNRALDDLDTLLDESEWLPSAGPARPSAASPASFAATLFGAIAGTAVLAVSGEDGLRAAYAEVQKMTAPANEKSSRGPVAAVGSGINAADDVVAATAAAARTVFANPSASVSGPSGGSLEFAASRLLAGVADQAGRDRVSDLAATAGLGAAPPILAEDTTPRVLEGAALAAARVVGAASGAAIDVAVRSSAPAALSGDATRSLTGRDSLDTVVGGALLLARELVPDGIAETARELVPADIASTTREALIEDGAIGSPEPIGRLKDASWAPRDGVGSPVAGVRGLRAAAAETTPAQRRELTDIFGRIRARLAALRARLGPIAAEVGWSPRTMIGEARSVIDAGSRSAREIDRGAIVRFVASPFDAIGALVAARAIETSLPSVEIAVEEAVLRSRPGGRSSEEAAAARVGQRHRAGRTPIAPPAAEDLIDRSVDDGWFFPQTGDGDGTGFEITDRDGIGFWSEFRRVGGVAVLGYPISNRLRWEGRATQVFQRAVMQWDADGRSIAYVNIFDRLHDERLDGWLNRSRQTPRQQRFDDPAAWDDVVAVRRALLDDYPEMRAAFDARGADALLLNGLPTSAIVDMGNHFAIRTQRTVFQLWKDDVPWARAGEVTVALGGDIFKEAGILPDDPALIPAFPRSR